MRPRSILVLLFLALLRGPAVLAKTDDPPPLPEPDEFETYYYMEKEPNDLADYLKRVQKSGLLEQHMTAVYGTAGFLAVVFHEHPRKIARWAKSAKYDKYVQTAIQRAMWISGHGDQIEKLFGTTPDFAKKKAPSLKKWPIEWAGDIDLLWGAFHASGDVAYVSRIVDSLHPEFKIKGDELAQKITPRVAEMSLESRLLRHELVFRQIVKASKSKSRPDVVKEKLKKILAAVPDISLPDKDGPFSARLYIMDKKDGAEFAKSTGSPLNLKEKRTARRGESIIIKILFVGLALNENLEADVDYDLKFFDPDGKVIEGFDQKGREALQQRVPTRFRFYDNREVIGARFDPTDKSGKYIVEVTIRDNIGKKSVSMKQHITLQD